MIDAVITIDGQDYPVCFNTHAQYALDVHCRREKLPTNAGEIIDRVMARRAGVMEMVLVMWAMMEGGRKRKETRARPYMVDEVNDLIDKLPGGLVEAMEGLLAALAAAAPKATESKKKKGEEDDPERKNEQSGSTSSGIPSSKPPFESESLTSNSGG